jgi:hypothetical protein
MDGAQMMTLLIAIVGVLVLPCVVCEYMGAMR